jgi:hypothetical protein
MISLFNELVNSLLSADSIIEEAKRHSEDITGRDVARGERSEAKFANVLKQRFGPGRYFKQNRQPKGVFTRAKEDLKAGEIAWYSGSEHQDKILHYDFIVNVNPIPSKEEAENMAKEEFNKLLDLNLSIDDPDFEMFWYDDSYQQQRMSARRFVASEIEKRFEVVVKTFEVKGYKDDVKRIHNKPSAIMVETVNSIGKRGWLYGAADFIAYQESENFGGTPNGFLIVNRPQLAEYVNDYVDLSPEGVTSRKDQAWYRQYRRTDKSGMPKQDLVAHIDINDARKRGVQMEFWSGI